MRIVLCSHRYPPTQLGGVEHYTQMLASELARAGEEVHVITRAPAAEPTPLAVASQIEAGVAVHRLVGGQIGADILPYDHARVEELTTLILRQAKPDVVHVTHLMDLAPRLLPLARQQGAATVLSLHDFYMICPRAFLNRPSGDLCAGPEGGRACARVCFAHEGAGALARWSARAALYRRLLDHADRLHCASVYIERAFTAAGVAADRVRRIPNGIMIGRGRPLLAPVSRDGNAPLRLAYFGSVAPHKGVHLILEALGRARLERVSLRVLGTPFDWRYVRALREQAAAIPGLHLRLAGAYEPAELRLLLADVDCAVLPSQAPESFQLAAYEALALGVPIIVTRIGGQAEAVAEGENGFAVAPDRPDELAVILQRLARDEALLARLRHGAAQTAVVHATEHMRRMRAVYVEAIEERRAAAPRQDVELDELLATAARLARGAASS